MNRKHMLVREFFREIRGSRNRFISILLIVILGVAFFSGVRAASPDMKLSADTYFDETNLMDIRILSTLGLTEDDVEALREIEGVEAVEPSYSADVLCRLEDSQPVLHLMAVTGDVNQVTISEGRIPQKADEILLDEKFMGANGLEIGDRITVYSGDEDEEIADTLSETEYTIVGSGTSPFYLSLDRGTSTIGNGSVGGFGVLLPESFSMAAYSEIYLTVAGAEDLLCYADAYEDLIDTVKERIEDISDQQCEVRYASVKADGQEDIDEAKQEIADARKKLADAKEELEDGKKQLQDGKDEINEKEAELEDGKSQLASQEKTLEDGKAQLASAWQELRSQKAVLSDGLAELQAVKNQLAQKEKELAAGEQTLAEGEKQAADGEQQLTQAKAELESGEAALALQAEAVEAARAQLPQMKESLEQLNQMSPSVEEMAEALPQLKQTAAMLEQQLEQLEAAAGGTTEGDGNTGENKTEQGGADSTAGETEEDAGLPEDTDGAGSDEGTADGNEGAAGGSDAENPADSQAMEMLRAQIAELNEKITMIETLQSQKAQLEEGIRAAEAGIQEYDSGILQVQQGRAQLEAEEQKLMAAKQELIAARARVEQGRQQLETGKAQIASGEAQLQEGSRQLAEAEQLLYSKENQITEGEEKIREAEETIREGEKALAEAKETLMEKETELQDAQEEFDRESEKAEEEIRDGEEKIADAQEALDKLEVPTWYVLGRNSIQTYVEYEQDAERVEAIGNVFPAIFFLVAALICLTTMTRMVEENRTQIGVLKAMGYGKAAIAGKYLAYAFLASLIGCVIGVFAGQKTLPVVIIRAYKIMYNNLPVIRSPMYLGYSLSSSLLAIGITVIAAGLSCWNELRAVPAQLMRPEAPKQGKRIFLEYLPFIWNRMSFSQKATARNLFRYKKRFFMTVLGIGGCMGLLLVGFGLKDSIMAIGQKQFGEIRTYSSTLNLDGDITEEEREALLEFVSEDSDVTDYMEAMESSVDVGFAGEERSSYMVVVSDPQQLKKFVRLKDRISQEEYELDDEGVVITEKLAKLLDLQEGDTIYLKDGETKRMEVTVSHIAENYYFHYVYMTAAVYEQLYGKEPEYTEVFTVNTSKDEVFEEEFQKKYMDVDGVLNITMLSTMEGKIADMIRSMDTIIYVIVIAAGLLAFVVLYNLNNINISERRRELATLKVLGFYEGEVSLYVFRENIVLTLIGALVGVGFGLLLHRFVILTAEIDLMMFGRELKIMSYFYSICLTFLFSLLVNLFMHFKLRKLDMVESMKSVE